jgi:hypothetical protein
MDKTEVDRLVQGLVDKGKIIEAGWLSYRIVVVPDDAPEIQIEESRRAFFAGAQHLFGSIMQMLEPDAEPTEADLRRMSSINDELDAYIADFKRRHGIAPTH